MSAQALIVTATSANLAATLARLARDVSQTQLAIADFQLLVDEGTLAPGDFIVVHPERHPQVILGAIITQRLGGAQAAVWTPIADDERIADALAHGAVSRLRDLGYRVLQAVTPIPSPPHMASLQKAGFQYISDLVFQYRDITDADAAESPTRLTLVPAAIDDLRFASVIDATYIASLDMPELNDTRSHEEILASCQAVARMEPPLWYFANLGNECVGVLQLAPQEENEFELLYMGLLPNARQQGLGRELAQCAIRITAAFGGTRLHLSYDARNHSAARAYDQLGFVERRRRAVWINFCAQTPLHSRSLPET